MENKFCDNCTCYLTIQPCRNGKTNNTCVLRTKAIKFVQFQGDVQINMKLHQLLIEIPQCWKPKKVSSKLISCCFNFNFEEDCNFFVTVEQAMTTSYLDSENTSEIYSTNTYTNTISMSISTTFSAETLTTTSKFKRCIQ